MGPIAHGLVYAFWSKAIPNSLLGSMDLISNSLTKELKGLHQAMSKNLDDKFDAPASASLQNHAPRYLSI